MIEGRCPVLLDDEWLVDAGAVGVATVNMA